MEKKSIFLKLWFPPPLSFFYCFEKRDIYKWESKCVDMVFTSCLDKVRRVADFKKQFNSSLDKLSV